MFGLRYPSHWPLTTVINRINEAEDGVLWEKGRRYGNRQRQTTNAPRMKAIGLSHWSRIVDAGASFLPIRGHRANSAARISSFHLAQGPHLLKFRQWLLCQQRAVVCLGAQDKLVSWLWPRKLQLHGGRVAARGWR